jgi:L-alanine-DL-glutamate epimerase-like enolase superfamily enzyme
MSWKMQSDIASTALIAAVHESFPIRGGFTIARGSKHKAEIVVATLTARLTNGRLVEGRGECVPYRRYGETLDGVIADIEAQRAAIAAGLNREGLQRAMKPGSARNALDCAYWDLEAKATGLPAWRLAGFADPPRPISTAFTLSLDTPEAMGKAAQAAASMPLLKLKLGGEGDDIARVAAVRLASPKARLIVDANEGWSFEQLRERAPRLAGLGVALIEQPLPAGQDRQLSAYASPVPLCADESCHGLEDLAQLLGLYQAVNIKLDKTGGLTHALELQRTATAAGFSVMVGCMVSTSLAMAPAFLLAQQAEFVDLDGPLLLADDRTPAIAYDGAWMQPPPAELWG